MVNRIGAWVLAGLFFLGPASAYVDRGQTLEDVTAAADLIVHGRVVSADARWVDDERGVHIYTYGALEPLAFWKGQSVPALTIEFPGGQVGSLREVVSDTLPVEAGDEVVVFLKNGRPFAGARGIFKVALGQAIGFSQVLPAQTLRNQVHQLVDPSGSPPADPVFSRPEPLMQLPGAGRGAIPGDPVPAFAVLPPGVAGAQGSTPSSPGSLLAEEMVLIEGFEGSFPGSAWTLSGAPTWGTTTFSAGLGTHSAWCGASSLNPAEGYASSMDAWMVHGPFSLAGVTGGRMDFVYRNTSESGADEFWWLVSIDGTNFYGFKVSGDQTTWRPGLLDFTSVPQLGNITGSPEVWIAFAFTSDASITLGAGAFVDDVRVRRGTPGTADLVMDGWQIPPANSVEGSPYWVKGLVKNLGPQASGASSARLYLSPLNDGNTADDYLVGTQAVPALDALEETWVTWNFTVPDLGSGTYSLWPVFVVDPDNQVDEVDEDNLFGAGSSITVMPSGSGVPVITSISPSTASAGTDTSVVIGGAGFGALQGQSKVEFFYRSGQPKIQASCASWSNTELTCTVPIGTVGGYPGSAGSGPVTVTTGGGTSTGYPFPVTFGYGQVRWPGESTTFRINENAPSCTGEGAAVQTAANTWNSAGSRFRFEYDGPTTATTASHDFTNQVTWGTTQGSIATAYYWMTESNIIEADIVFNTDFEWSTADTVPGDGMDVQTIALHEMGHWLSLRDLYGNIGDGHNDQAKVMYGFGAYGLTKRELKAEDQAGIRYIYGSGLVVTGKVTVAGGAGLGGVTLSGFPASVVTAGDGTFTAPVTSGWSGSFTPAKSGYVFEPAVRTLDNVTEDASDQDFTATFNQPSLQGRVTNSRGRGVPGVKISLTNKGGSGLTDAQGAFAVAVKSGWSGKLSISRSGVTFLTSRKSFSNVTGPVTGQDFTAKDLVLSGKAKDSKGRGLSGVTLTFVSSTGEEIQAVATSANGSYSVSAPLMWSGSVIPSLAGTAFTPSSRTFNGLSKNTPRQDFKGTHTP